MDLYLSTDVDMEFSKQDVPAIVITPPHEATIILWEDESDEEDSPQGSSDDEDERRRKRTTSGCFNSDPQRLLVPDKALTKEQRP